MSIYEKTFSKLPSKVRQIILNEGVGPKLIQRKFDEDYMNRAIKAGMEKEKPKQMKLLKRGGKIKKRKGKK